VLGNTVSRLHVISNKLCIKNDYEFHDTAEEVIELPIMPLLKKY